MEENESLSSDRTFIVIESASKLLEASYETLVEDGHIFFFEESVYSCIQTLKTGTVRLIVLESDKRSDIVDMVQALRKVTEIPILIVTVESKEADALHALTAGADDYLLADVAAERLSLTIKTMTHLRKRLHKTTQPFQIGDLYLDLAQRKVYLANKILALTSKEYEVLRFLVIYRGLVLSHQQLLTYAWGPEYRSETQYLWVTMSRLRRKLEPNQDSERYIFNEPRVGYRFREE